MAKKSNKSKKDNKYNAENEIIIGVTTKPKEKVRVENKKTTRPNTKSTKKKKTNKTISKKNTTNSKSRKNTPKTKFKTNNINYIEEGKEEIIKRSNAKKIILSISIVLFLALCGTIYYLTTPVFNIANIEVYGNKKNSIDTYISLSGINLNEKNIFAFSKKSIEQKIKENQYVESIEIKRKLPNTIQLHIKERTVDYQAQYMNSYIYLNNQGYILEINADEKDILEITGLSTIAENLEIGQRLDDKDLIRLDTVLKIVNYLKYNNNSEFKLTNIDVSEESNYTLKFKEENKVAYIGDSSSITEKMTAVVKIMEAEKNKKGTIYADETALKRNRTYFSEKK